MTNNEMKLHTINEISDVLRVVGNKLNILEMLDDDVTTSGYGDLHDQINSMYNSLNGFEQIVKRATAVVPDMSDKYLPSSYAAVADGHQS